MTRVLVLSSSYPTPAHPTASAFLQDWASALAALGHSVTVIAPDDAAPPARRIEPAAGPRVVFFQYAPRKPWQTLAYGGGMYDNVVQHPLRGALVPLYLRAQYRHARALAVNAEIVHAHWLFPAGLVAWRLAQRLRLPFVVTIHSTDVHLLSSIPGGRRIAVAIARAASHLHFVADHHRRRFVSWLGGSPASWHLAPMGIADAVIETPAVDLASSPRIGYMGRLIGFKGVDRLIRACAALGVRHLQIAGEGPERASLEALASSLNVPVRFAGPVAGGDKIRFLDGCDVLVFPSGQDRSGRGEGVPVSLIETLARGRIAIASDSGGTGEIIRDGQSGFLFPAGDDDALRATLDRVIGSWPAMAPVAQQARQSMRPFSATAVARQQDTIYTDILSQPTRQRARA